MLLTAETFHHPWLGKEHSEDARFWAHWLTVPGRLTLPEDGKPPREGLKYWDSPTGWPSSKTTEVNLRTLYDRVPTSFDALVVVMHRLRLADALPDATAEQRLAGEAHLLAGELELLYVYGHQVRHAGH